jgi:hypothetical protein
MSEDTTGLESYLETWLEPVRDGNPSTVEQGRTFITRICSQWLRMDPDDPDLIYCDGPGDGGIDAAYLMRGMEESESVGDTWYLFQGKLGGVAPQMLITEGTKVIDTLSGHKRRGHQLSAELFARLREFRTKASLADKIIYVVATERALSREEREVLEQVRTLGREKLGCCFEVESISVEALWHRIQEDDRRRTTFPLTANLVREGDHFVGSVKLLNLYAMMESYRRTEDLERLFAKNIRQYLRSRRANKKIQATLRDAPQAFGLRNNGIAIVADQIQEIGPGRVSLEAPAIVNGAQTSQSIWIVLGEKLGSGGTGDLTREAEDWHRRVRDAWVPVKLAQVGKDSGMVSEITRFSNTQTAVRDKDFLSLRLDVQAWAREFERRGVFLEIQPGGWDARRSLLRQRPSLPQLAGPAGVLDLLKVYGSAHLRTPGKALRSNDPFTEGGDLFVRAVSRAGAPFGADDLFACYQLLLQARQLGFGQRREGSKPSRRVTKFLFFFIFAELLSWTLSQAQMPRDEAGLTRGILTLSEPDNRKVLDRLARLSAGVVDRYMDRTQPHAIDQEHAYVHRNMRDISDYLRLEALGTPEYSANLHWHLEHVRVIMAGGFDDRTPMREVLLAALQGTNGKEHGNAALVRQA